MNKVSYNSQDFKSLLPIPDINANKYSRGCCHIVAGSSFYPGAAILCSQSAARSGAGYVNLYTCDNHVSQTAITYPTVPVKSFQILDNLDFSKLHKPYSFVIGSGFDAQDSSYDGLIAKIATDCEGPLVIDGGALSRLANRDTFLSVQERGKHGRKTIITPHLGEAITIAGSEHKEDDATTIAEILADKFNCVCILKGPDTFICDTESQYAYVDAGPELSIAGTGDVLAGILGSVLATGKVSVFDSAALSVHIHATSAKLAKDYLGPIGTTAADVLENIPFAINEIFLA